jgi:serine/threonine protein kinase
VTELLDRLKTALADRYRLKRELGGGGMAVVYLAHDQKLNRPALPKVIRPELAASLETERFLREVEAAGTLTHPNILAPYDCGSAGGLLYYVMPFVKGEPLRRRMGREPRLSIDEVLEIAGQVAAALDHAHRQGIVHRDIRPENILLPEGRAIVNEFGIVRALKLAAGARLSDTGISKGRPYYMSPEQVLGDEVDARSDLYSLGATLFEVVTGEKPFEGETAQQIVAQHLANPVRQPRELAPNVPAWVSELIVRCMQKAPADRLQGAGEMVQALGAGAAPPDSSAAAPAAADQLGAADVVQGAGWDFDDLVTPEVKPPPQPVHDLDAVEERPRAPEPAPPSRPPEQAAPPPEPVPPEPVPPEPAVPAPGPVTTGGDLVSGGWFDRDQSESLATPAPEPAERAEPPKVAPSGEVVAPDVTAWAGDAIEMIEPSEAEPVELGLEAPVAKAARVPPWLRQLYDWGPELLVRLARQRETWYHVAKGIGVVLAVVLVALVVKSVFFRPAIVHYQFIRNELVEPVDILMDGQTVHRLEAGQRDSLIVPRDRPVGVSWRLVRPQQGSQEMGEEFEVLLSSGAARREAARWVIRGVTLDRAMFAPRITNRTDRDLVALVNRGTSAEQRCNCIIPAATEDVHIGYYPLLENSTIRFFDAQRAYRGQFQEIGDISARVDTLSGSVGVTIERF